MEAPERILSSGKTKPSRIYFKHKRMELSFPRHMLCSSLSHYCGCHLPQHALGRLLPWGTKPSSCPPPPGSHRPAPAAGSPCKHSWQEDTYFIIPSPNSEICPYLTRISMTRESSCHFKTETLGPLLGTSWWLSKSCFFFFNQVWLLSNQFYVSIRPEKDSLFSSVCCWTSPPIPGPMDFPSHSQRTLWL